MAVEVGGGDACGVGDVVGVGNRYPSKRFAAEEPPPALDEGEPGSSDRNKGLLPSLTALRWVAQVASYSESACP